MLCAQLSATVAPTPHGRAKRPRTLGNESRHERKRHRHRHPRRHLGSRSGPLQGQRRPAHRLDLQATVTATTAPSSDSFTGHELAAWRGMLEVHARVTRQLDAQMRSEHGLSVSAYEVLMFLADAPDHRLRMSEIADRVLLSRSGLTRLVDRLVVLGYVTRCAAEGDGRGAFAELTDAGVQKFE